MLCIQYSTYIINLVNGEYLRIECLCESQLLTALRATCPEQVLEGDSLPGSIDVSPVTSERWTGILPPQLSA